MSTRSRILSSVAINRDADSQASYLWTVVR
jgi:hypothetical protein